MNFRLTYALDRESLVTVELNSHDNDFMCAYETAIAYIEEQHGAQSVVDLLAISIIRIEEVIHAN